MGSRYAFEARAGNAKELGDVLASAAMKSPGARNPVVFASSDTALAWLTREGIYGMTGLRFTFPAWTTLRRLADKGAVGTEAVDIPQPLTLCFSAGDDLESVAGKAIFPGLVKPAECQAAAFNAVFHAKNVVAQDAEQLRNVLKRSAEGKLSVVVQEFIPGGEFAGLMALYDTSGRRAAWCKFKVIRKLPALTGCATSQICGVEVDIDAGILDGVAARVGYWGVAEAEFKRDSRDGKWKLMEINTRPVLQNRGFAAAGVDFEYLLYQLVCGTEPEREVAPTKPVLWVEHRNDLAAAVREYHLGLMGWRSTLGGAKVSSVFAADDPWPMIRRGGDWLGTLGRLTIDAFKRPNVEVKTMPVKDQHQCVVRNILAGSPLPWVMRQAQPDPVVVTYHGVIPRSEWREWETADLVPDDLFREHLEFYRRSYNVVPLRAIADFAAGRGKLPPCALAITFDDGYRNVVEHAVPMLKEFGFPATIFLTSGFVEGRVDLWWLEVKRCVLAAQRNFRSIRVEGLGDFSPRTSRDARESYSKILAHLRTLPATERRTVIDALQGQFPAARDLLREVYAPMTWEQARAAAAQGMEMGAHCVTHPILSRETEDDARREIVESVAAVRKEVGPERIAFSYPNGLRTDFTRNIERMVRDAGCYAAAAEFPGYNRVGTPVYQLRRFPVGGHHSLAALKLDLCGFRGAVKAVTGLPGKPEEPVHEGIAEEEEKFTPRRVALVVNRMMSGGKEHVVMHLAMELARAGHVPMVVCMREMGALGRKIEKEGIPVYAMESSRGWDVLTVFRLARLLRRFGPDVINVHDISSQRYVAAANVLMGRRPVVLTCHGLLLWKQRPSLVDRLVTRSADEVTAVSEACAGQYRQYMGLDRPVKSIANGVPIREPDRKRGQNIRDELELKAEDFLFVAAGSVRPEKGYEDLLEACEILRRKRGERKFAVAVFGEVIDQGYRDRLASQSAQLKLDKVVRFMGHRDEVQAIYGAGDGYVLPSRTEGLPMAMLEAMAAGLPVVASAVGGVPALLGSDAGVLAKCADPASLADAMASVLEAPLFADLLASRGKELVHSQYSAAIMMKGYLGIYEDVIRRRGGRCEAGDEPAGVIMLGPRPPLVGGMASVVENLRCSELSRRCRLTMINNGKTTSADRSLASGVTAQLRLAMRLLWEMAKGNGRIVHIHTCSGFTFWRDSAHMCLAGLMGCRVVWHIHGGGFAAFAERQKSLGRAWIRRSLSRAAAVIVLGRESFEQLKPIAPLASWHVVPNGVSLAASSASLGDNVFLFLGNLGPRKGTIDLVNAASIACKDGFNARIDLAGDEVEPGQRETLRGLISEAGLSGRVRLVGVLAGEEKARAMASACCLVLPSHVESLPMAVLEAMACGLPVIVTRVGVLPTLVRDGVDGFIIDPGDTQALADRMRRMEREPEMRLRMGAAARQRVEAEYGLEKMARRIMDVYAEIGRAGA